ncbi:MAG: hypothetical protein ACPG4Z_01985 [Chitinophagales bacterium]
MDNKQELEDLFKSGIKAFDEGQFRLARKKFKEILKIAPDNSIAKQKLEEIEKQFSNQVTTNKKKEKKALIFLQ